METCPVCHKEGKQTCAGCRKVFYCSKDHQVHHWKQHKTECRPFEIATNTELGRHLLAKRDIKNGSQIISEFPLVIGPKVGAGPLCLGCYAALDPETSYRCSGCEWPCCDPLCPGLKSQDHHLLECIVLSRNPQPARIGDLRYDTIMPLRCLLLQKKNSKKWKQLLTLESHIKDRNETTEIYKEIEENTSKYLLGNYISFDETEVFRNVSSELIHVLCGIIEVNSLEISTDKEEIVALYPTACLMEHNCLPNVKYSFNMNDYKITIKAVDDIEQGTHICTMYTHSLWGTAARREQLLRTKYFMCNCRRCNDPTELGTNFSTLRCVGYSTTDIAEVCGGDLLPVTGEPDTDWKCSKCPLVLSSIHVGDFVSRLGSQVDMVMESPNVSKMEKLLDKLEKLLHPNHYHCFTVAHSLVQLWGREEGYSHDQLSDSVLSRKIELCRRITALTLILDPSSSRTGLYTSVALLEEHSALLETARRTDQSNLKQKFLREARSCLESAKLTADHQGTGAKLLSVIETAFRNLMKEFDNFLIL